MAVIMNTSVGDIVIDLHTDLCPLTSKNFLKLCKMKYYSHCLFHDVKKDFIAQTGDPTGTGSGGDSLYKHLYGDQARFFNDEIHPKLTHDKIGTVAMASAGENLNASQFYITLRAGLDYLDGKHTVFGEVAEGLDTLMRINEAFVDDNGRPLKNIRIKHIDVLDDPFDDPSQLAELIPDESPELRPPAEGENIRLEDDWVPMDERMDPEELDKSLRKKEAQSRAVVLEMIGDIPEAEVAPPENVLFICKLNPVTEEGDLETIFSRFGKVVAADIIRDYKTGDSLCYGFIEFENKEVCEAAYFKMDNVLIDDRRIHVDFSQSVAKLWTRFRKIGTKDTLDQGNEKSRSGGCFICGEFGHRQKDCPNAADQANETGAAPVEKPKYTLKESGQQRGNPRTRYDMVFDDDAEDSRGDRAKHSDIGTDARSRSERHSNRSSGHYNERQRARPRTGDGAPDDGKQSDGRHESSRHRHRKQHGDSDDEERRSSRSPSPSRNVADDRRQHSSLSRRSEAHREKKPQDRELGRDIEDRSDSRRSRSDRHDRSERNWKDRQQSTDDLQRPGRSQASRRHDDDDRRERSFDDDDARRRSRVPAANHQRRHEPESVTVRNGQTGERQANERSDRDRDRHRRREEDRPNDYHTKSRAEDGREEDRKGRRRSPSPKRERISESRDRRRERTPLSDDERMAKRPAPKSGRERHREREERYR